MAAFCGFKPRSKCLQSCLPLVNQRCLMLALFALTMCGGGYKSEVGTSSRDDGGNGGSGIVVVRFPYNY
ncbi:MAG: hypothetical protein LBC77_05530 [Spirochaetaceae bacterium]|nr:hypothetical protein [Spirochaetaceae bacterium]